MRVYSDAVPNPRTVMIHAHNTFTTDRAVMSAWCLYRLALFTVSESDVIVDLIYELLIYHIFCIENSLVVHSSK